MINPIWQVTKKHFSPLQMQISLQTLWSKLLKCLPHVFMVVTRKTPCLKMKETHVFFFLPFPSLQLKWRF